MTAPLDAIVVGGGHNGLVTAAYLAKAGRRTLVLERREEPGGAAELALTVGRLSPTVVRDLRLTEHGVAFIRPAVRAFAPDGNGGGLTLWADPARTASELAARSKADADAFPKFDAKVRAVASFLRSVASGSRARSAAWATEARPARRSASCRWPWRTWWARYSRPTRSARRSRPAGSGTRRWVRGQRGRQRTCCSTRRGTTVAPLERRRSRAAARSRSGARSRMLLARSGPRSDVGRPSSGLRWRVGASPAS
ncbi:MAG: FAD-dependent oxidoreductase [Deltaproteobacteria bacterium]|nr:MAG: FAD-dependent oxidoreductase [Deltaproteobacteria bacterium]